LCLENGAKIINGDKVMEDIKIKICKQCGTIINSGEFCDTECRKIFWSEIRKDQNYHLYNLKLN
jgi:predicted nucleic acid-binding Zn ribbon protein